MTRKDLIEKLRKIDIVEKNPVLLKHAGDNNVYFDVKKAYGDPEALEMIADEMAGGILSDTTVVAGSGYGGLPLASVIAVKRKLKLALVREEPKKWGLNKYIDGYVPSKDDRVAVVDDVRTTGRSLREVIERIEKTGAYVNGCYVVVDRKEWEYIGLSMPISVCYLFKSEDLL